MTQEFLISVTPVGDDEYLVRTERTLNVPSGVPLAEEQVKWPVDEWLRQSRHLMSDPLWGVLESAARGGSGDFCRPESPPMSSLVELGQELYNHLFQGTLRDSWTSAQAIAHHRRESLQLRLGVKGSRLASLPWEVLHEGGRPIATGTDILFSRYQPGTGSRRPSLRRLSGQPLKILMAIATPADQDSLQLQREALQLQQELRQESGHSRPIELTILEQPDREQITQALERGQYQIFHYAGHSSYTSTGGALYLVSGRTGLTETISGEDLAGLLANNGIQIAVLNSCRGAYSNLSVAEGETPELNLAEALVKRGIPGVLAMAERIPDEVALTLTRLFYRNLNQGSSVDLSLSRARQGLISAYGSHQLYWALPVLYLHHEFDGILTANSSENWDFDDLEDPESFLKNDEFLSDSFDESLDLDGMGEDFPSFIGEELGKIKTARPAESRGRDSLPDGSGWPSPPTPPPQPSPLKLGLLLAVIVLPLSWGLWRFQDRILPLLGAGSYLSASESASNHLNSATTQATALEVAGTDQVLGIAIEQFDRGNLDAGVEAVTELLNRGALPEANAALTAVPVQDADDPSINFLKGRLAWQSIERGSADYTRDDVRRFWARAVQQRPTSLKYQTALGFAYYAEGNLERAYLAWYRTLELEDPALTADPATPASGVMAASAKSTAEPSEENENREVLDAYAGLGLVLMRSAQSWPTEEKMVQLSKAVKFRDKVRSEAPGAFTPHSLSQNWLWSGEMIRDWQLLLRQDS
ncbi:MAG: CHAT domain-containing protein [Limnospira sp.]